MVSRLNRCLLALPSKLGLRVIKSDKSVMAHRCRDPVEGVGEAKPRPSKSISPEINWEPAMKVVGHCRSVGQHDLLKPRRDGPMVDGRRVASLRRRPLS